MYYRVSRLDSGENIACSSDGVYTPGTKVMIEGGGETASAIVLMPAAAADCPFVITGVDDGMRVIETKRPELPTEDESPRETYTGGGYVKDEEWFPITKPMPEFLKKLTDKYVESLGEIGYCALAAFGDPVLPIEFDDDEERDGMLLRLIGRMQKGEIDGSDYRSLHDTVCRIYDEELVRCGFPENEIGDVEEIMYTVFLHNIVRSRLLISVNDFPNFIPPEIPNGDIDVISLANLLCEMRPHEDLLRICREADIDAHYEHTHAVIWLSSQVTAGTPPYDRHEPNLSAKTTYNRLLNPNTLIWIAAALGEEPETIRRAAEARDSAGNRPAQKCGAVRRVLPFSRIWELEERIACGD